MTKRKLLAGALVWLFMGLLGMVLFYYVSPILEARFAPVLTEQRVEVIEREPTKVCWRYSWHKERYAFDLELLILAHHNGYLIGQAPVVVDFKGKYGRITPIVIFNIFWDTLAIFYRLRIRKYYDRQD